MDGTLACVAGRELDAGHAILGDPAHRGPDPEGRRLCNHTEIDRLRGELAALREQAEKHRLLIETTDTAFVILDEAGRVLDANAEYVRLSGHARLQQIQGRPVTDWTAPEDRERNAAEVRRCVAGQAIRNLEGTYLSPNGRRTPVEIDATARRTPGGLTILSVCRAATARRGVEEALRNSEYRYCATIDSMCEAIHVVNADLRIELVNRTGAEWFRLMGIEGDVVGRGGFEAFPFLPEEVRDEYRRVFAGEGPLITEEVNSVAGREVVTETRKIPILEGGRVVSVVTVIRDVTEAVLAREQLLQAAKLDAIGRLASGIAHDFNNQLAVVLGYAELLSIRATDPQLQEYAALITQVARRSADLTEKLLAFGRKGRAQSVPVDVHELIHEVVAILGRTIDPRITIRLRLCAARAVVIGDPSPLQSALLNLALNARDAMPAGGDLTFATDLVELEPSAGGAGLRIRVVDTGVGMSEEVRRRLFEPFFTTKEPGRGTGMGLAAVYGTISDHHGTIQVESEPGRGATFTLVLPLADGAIGAGAPAPGAPAVQGGGHVLVADDTPEVLRAECDILEALGFRVTACSDGAAALARYREAWSSVDLVLLDGTMPGLDGREALAEMRRINPAVRAVLASGHPPGPAEQRLIDELGAGFLQKPFSMAELSRCVAAALGAEQG